MWIWGGGVQDTALFRFVEGGLRMGHGGALRCIAERKVLGVGCWEGIWRWDVDAVK